MKCSAAQHASLRCLHSCQNIAITLFVSGDELASVYRRTTYNIMFLSLSMSDTYVWVASDQHASCVRGAAARTVSLKDCLPPTS